MSVSLEEKKAFFAHLDRLDNLTDDDDDDDDLSDPEPLPKKRRIAKTVGRPVKTKESSTISVETSIPRELATSDVPPLRRAATQGEDVRAQSSRRSPRTIARRTNSEPNPQSRSAQTNGNRASKQLFHGLTFYFIPNDDVDKIRRRRIQSAIAQGATWARKLDSSVTHIIADPKIDATRALRVLRDQVDLTQVPLVKDTWLIECLSQKDLRDVAQGRFQLKGSGSLPQFADVESRQTEPKKPTGEDASVKDTAAEIDDLSKIMNELKSAPHLPFDDEVDLDKFNVSFSSGDELPAILPLAPESRPVPCENRGFVCMEAHTGISDYNPNNRTLEVLQEMASYYDRTGDHWRTSAYRKAIAALRKQQQLISTRKEALAIHGIGNRLADKIEEIVTTDRLARLDEISSDPTNQVLQLFMGIYGVGLTQARQWMDQGYRTLEDLKTSATLTPNQQIGIDHYDDFEKRIPRAEVAQHGACVQKALKRTDRRLEAIIGGSYRRGLPDSGDIDVMITHPTADLSQLREWVFDDVVPHLFKIGFMKCALATSRSRNKAKEETTPKKAKGEAEPTVDDVLRFASSDSSGTKFLGASQISPSLPWRRIDLLLVPVCSLGANLLYFTGNDIFNRSMRLLASRKGMRLNQHGLYKNVKRGPNRVKETDGELVEGRSERRIFEILGVPWRTPEERQC